MKKRNIPKIPGYYITEALIDPEKDGEDSNNFLQRNYNPTDNAVLKALGLSKEPLSPYEIEPIIGKAYNQVYYSCKKLAEDGFLLKSETKSAKKGKKFVYSLSYLGYNFCISSLDWWELETILKISENCRSIIHGIDICLRALENIKETYSEEDFVKIENDDKLVTQFITGVSEGIPTDKKTYSEKITGFIIGNIWASCCAIVIYMSEQNIEEKLAKSIFIDVLLRNFVNSRRSNFTTVLIDNILPAFKDEPEFKNIRELIKPDIFKLIYQIRLYALILDIPDEAECNLNKALETAFEMSIF